jgi:hypothetical protein
VGAYDHGRRRRRRERASFIQPIFKGCQGGVHRHRTGAGEALRLPYQIGVAAGIDHSPAPPGQPPRQLSAGRPRLREIIICRFCCPRTRSRLRVRPPSTRSVRACLAGHSGSAWQLRMLFYRHQEQHPAWRLWRRAERLGDDRGTCLASSVDTSGCAPFICMEGYVVGNAGLSQTGMGLPRRESR